MAERKSLNLLPGVFQTDTNRKFLSATLDQLISEPNLTNINGYIGRQFAPTYKNNDSYIIENSPSRQNYQLEPSVVVKDDIDKITLFADYVSLLDKIKYYGGVITNHDRLFENEFYSYDPGISYDKFVNFSQYYWLPDGPDPVNVNATGYSTSDDFTVIRNFAAGRYEYDAEGTISRSLTLVRGGTYTFTVNQPGHKFWIQSEPGVDGRLNAVPTISSRTVAGVTNNGADVGTVTFKVPLVEEHSKYVSMPTVFQVDYAAPLAYSDLHNCLRSVFLARFPQYAGIIGQLDGKYLIFVDEFVNANRGEEIWTARGVYDLNGFQISSYDEGEVVPLSKRYGVWKVVFVNSGIEDDPLLRLVWVQDVLYNEKVYIKYGLVNANIEFYKENTGFFVRVPLLTALQNELYVQDSERADIFTKIKIVDPIDNFIDVENDILGQKTYTSPNGVVFTSGLKIEFGQDVIPEKFKNKEYYVENVGDSINLVDVDLMVTPELYHDELAANYPDQVFPEYITIKRDALDLNGWSRANRWFHIDIITKTAEYNNATPVYDQKLRAQRPIIQFEGNYRLFNQGRLSLDPIDALDATSIDPFNDFEGKVLETAFGVKLFDGLRVLFAVALDPEVRGKIYRVNLVQYDADPITGEPTGPFYIKLDLEVNTPIQKYATTVVKDGQFKGSGWWFDGTRWKPTQEKTQPIQIPLFDVFDNTGKSLSDWPNSTFKGTRIFGYLENTAGPVDPVLGFPLKYRNFGTQGDIEFKNYFDSDTFSYDKDGVTVSGLKVSENGFIEKVIERESVVYRNCWRKVIEPSKQYQIFTYQYSSVEQYTINEETQCFGLDITPLESFTIPYVKVYVNNRFLTEGSFVVEDKIVQITEELTIGDKVDILVYSNQTSSTAYYEVPSNLNLNAQNLDIDQFTLGQIRNHLVALSQNSLDLDRPVLGPNNLRDLEVKQQGGTILQHSAPTPYSAVFLIDETANFVNSVRYSQNEYTKFKNKFMELASTLPGLNPNTPDKSVDTILANLNAIKNPSFPWFYSDMVPYGNLVNNIEYTVFDPLVKSYEITSIFDDTQLSNRAVLVYRNGIQLLKDIDYTFDRDRPAITFKDSLLLEIDDKILIVEYQNTDGNYIPETPTKLGLYPKFLPEIFIDNTYRTPIAVIRGHDGSITPAFNDFRDTVILELEKRIYNNIKQRPNTDHTLLWDALPGKFRNNNYTRQEITQVLNRNFLLWVGSNRIDFNTNSTFLNNDDFSWNYSRFTDRLDDEQLPGSWRACYLYFYDTVMPHIAPWEMLGFSIKPNWWESFYGPAPYTGGNALLWDDLEKGLVRDGEYAGIRAEFARPGLSKIIPVDSNGNLLSPAAVMAKFSSSKYAASAWNIGDYGPAEWAWRQSSDFPFAVQQALAILKPAKYFSTKFDLSRYYYREDIQQYLFTNNKPLRQQDFKIHGSIENSQVIRAAGYGNFICAYLKNLGIDAKTKIDSLIKKFEVKLAYKLAGFSDKKFLRVLAEQSSPTSTNDSVLIPDENYYIHLHKSAPIQRITYSGVIIEKTSNGYSVSGYNLSNPFFTIIPSVQDNNAFRIRVLNDEAVIFQSYQNLKLTVPYGYEFKNKQQVVDFLISYERFLIAQGFIFNEIEPILSENKDWKLSAREFLFWAQQGWKTGSILFLSPISNRLRFISENSLVDKIDDSQYGSKVLDQNFTIVRTANYDILRDSGEFILTMADTTSTIGLVEINLVQYEHVMIFDNTTVFNDIIYKPELGNRQFRLKLIGQKTADWDGSIYAPGFIFNEDNVKLWVAGKDYLRGDLVDYKTQYYVALENIPGESDFVFSKWKQITRQEIKTGLLPNFSTIASWGEYNYNSYADLKDENQIRFSHSLIGFKPRQYLDDLGLNDTTQIEFYKGYIKQKGTTNAIGQLTKAKFNNLTSDIGFFEEWAVRVGEYGALDINPALEFILDESQYSVNPAVITFTNEVDGPSQDNVTLGQRQLYRQIGSYNGSIALNRDDQTYYDSDLPTAGYVHIDDVDATIFDINDIEQLSDRLQDIGVGFTIWVAKDFEQDWNVYRVSETNNNVIRIDNALDGLITLTTKAPHEFEVGTIFIVRYFNSDVDNFYQVQTVNSRYQVTVIFKGNPDYLTTLISDEGNGIVLKLDSMRFLYMEDARIYGLTNPLNYWQQGDKIWIDVDAATAKFTGQPVDTPNRTWKVYEKTFPWQEVQRVTKNESDYLSNDGYGTSVKIGLDTLYAVAGSPYANVYILGSYVTTGQTLVFDKKIIGATNTEEFVQGDTIKPNAGKVLVKQCVAIDDRRITLDNTSGLLAGMQIYNSIINGAYIVGIETSNNTIITSHANVATANTSVLFSVINSKEFGTSIDLSHEFVAVGAPATIRQNYSNIGAVHIYNRPKGTVTFNDYQIIIPPSNEAGRFGSSIAMDEFGDWLYIGAPAVDKVYVYGLNKDIQQKTQLVSINIEKTITLSSSVSVTAGDILKQTLFDKTTNVVVSGISIVGNVLTLSSTIGLYPGMSVNAAFYSNVKITSVDEANSAVSMSSANIASINTVLSFGDLDNRTIVEATVLNTVNSNVITVTDRQGLYDGTGGNFITFGNIIHIPYTDPFLVPIDTMATIIGSTVTPITNTINLNFTPDLSGNANLVAQSLLVTDFNRIFIPEIDYQVTGNVVTFLTGALPAGDYAVTQRPYYHLVDVLQGPAGSEFGYALDSSLDGAQLAVGTPNDTVIVGVTSTGRKKSITAGVDTSDVISQTEYAGAGAVYVYDRVIEAFNTTGERDYHTTYPIGYVRNLLIDGAEITGYHVLQDPADPAGVLRLIRFDNPPPSGKVLFVESNKFNLLERLIGIDNLEGGLNAIQENARFGTDLTICSNNCAIYVGAPNYDSGTRYNIGAVWKFHNKGRLYGTNRGFTQNPTFAPNDSIRLDNFEVKVNLRLSGNLRINKFVADGINSTVGPMTFAYSPGEEGNVEVYIGDVEQIPTIDYVFNGTTQISFTSIPVTGTVITVTHPSISIGDTVTQPSTGASVTVTEIVNQSYLRISDYANSNVFNLGSGNLTIAGRTTSLTPVRSTLDDLVADINNENLLGISAVNENNYLRLVTDKTVAKNLLRTLSGRNISGNLNDVSNLYSDAGMAVFAFMQIIITPYSNDNEHFGNKVVLAKNAYMLVISSDRGTTRQFTTFDDNTTTLDDGSTEIFDSVKNSGSVYIFELYDDPRDRVEDPGRYAFAQQLDPGDLNSGDKFGASIDIVGSYIITSAPTDDTTSYFVFNNVLSLVPGNIITQNDNNLSRYEVVASSTIKINGNDKTRALVKPTRNHVPESGINVNVYVNNVFVNSYVETIIQDTGSVYIFRNPKLTRGWNLIRYQQPKVDIESVSRIFLYDRITNLIKTNIEFIDPAKGKILGIAEQEISYKTEYDPAYYNKGSIENVNVSDNLYWGPQHIGQVWWNLSKVRFLDYEQDTITYRGNNWGRLFPGSTVEICEWVESPVLPSEHIERGLDGEPLYADDSAYVEITFVDPQTNIIGNKYYYWVINKNSVDANNVKRSLPINAIRDLIFSPKAQNIPYAAILSENAIGLYNISGFLQSADTVCHIDYEVIRNNSIIHSEYECIQSGNPDSYIPEKISQKLIDSLSGQDRLGKIVPDPFLSPYDSYGISYRPRQSMFVDRLSALESLVQYVNKILEVYPIVREYELDYFNSEEPYPLPSEYDLRVQSVDELNYIDTAQISVGYKVLVEIDINNDNLWVIYEFTTANTWRILRTQGYKTSLYWDYIDWYAEGYDSSEIIEFVVDTVVDALKLPAGIGDEILVKVNKGPIATGWNLLTVEPNGEYRVVGIENGTIRLKDNLFNFADNKLGFGNQSFDSNRYDQNPSLEIRNILLGLKEDIFIRQLQGEFNKLFFVMVNYLFNEQKYVDWIFKTSFISVTHKLRALDQYPNYVKDNQTYYLDYINEVKPYSTKVREYNINYDGNDDFVGDITDFDLPPYYDLDGKIFRSPSGEQVDKDRQLWATGYIGDTLINIDYPSWYNNKNYSIDKIEIIDQGVGYTVAPEITIVGGGNTVTVKATAVGIIDFDTGKLIRIDVTNPGAGYSQTPTVLINGNGTSQAAAYAVIKKEFQYFGNANISLKNSKIRSFDMSMKFDRTSYTSNIRPWVPGATYKKTEITSINGRQYWVGGDILTHTVKDGDNFVRKAYTVPNDITVGDIFISEDFDFYHAANFATASDRIMAYYEPSADMPARDLNLLIAGIEYPGVEIQGRPFADVPGYAGSYTAQITFDNDISVGIGNIITQTESDLGDSVARIRKGLYLSSTISATIGQTLSQIIYKKTVTGNVINWSNSWANGTVYGNTINHGTGIGTLGDIVDSSSLYVLRPESGADSLPFTANTPSVCSPLENCVFGSNIFIDGVEKTINIWGNIQTQIISNVWVTTNNAPYSWSNVGVMPIEANVGTTPYVEFTIPDAKLTVTKIIDSRTVQGVIGSTQDFITGTTSLANGHVRVNGILQSVTPANITVISEPTALAFDSMIFDAFDIDEDGNPVLSEDNFDSAIRSFYTDSALGTRPEDINIDGGAYVDTYSSHAPEELVPGIVFDTLDMKIYENAPGAEIYAYKMFTRNFQFTSASSTNSGYSETTYLRMCDDYSTLLTEPLQLTDTVIHVQDASRLPTPSKENFEPGVIFIGAERITYYTRDLATNTLGQLRRGTKGTAAKTLHQLGAIVIDGSKQQLLPDTTWANVSYYPSSVTIDSINSLIDGSNITFDLKVSNVSYTISSIDSTMVVQGANVLQPNVDYTTSGNTITFTVAPTITNGTINIFDFGSDADRYVANANVKSTIVGILYDTDANGLPYGNGFAASDTVAAQFIKECSARNILGLVMTRALETDDSDPLNINILTTEDGSYLFEEDF